MYLNIYLVLGLTLVSVCLGGSHKKSVVVSMHAKWPQTSFLAEISEFMARDSRHLFWDYIDQIVDNVKVDEWNSYSDAKQHEVAVRLASNLLEPSQTKFLKFSLALRAHSPAVQLFQQLGTERDSVNCTAFAEVDDTITCDEKDLAELVAADTENTSSATIYSVDHMFPTFNDNLKTIFVYGELGTPKWLSFHKVSQSLAKKNEANYIFRHWVKDPREDNVLLSGYGVELAIKSTEYKAVDDSQLTNSSAVEEEDTEDVSEFEDINGFNFNALRKLYPDQKESLSQFRLHLLEKDELTPLKVWQVQDLSFQAAQRVASSGTLSALNSLTEISQNFPLMARSISRQIVKEDFRQEVIANQEIHFENIGLGEGDSALWINGINIDVDNIDVYSLLDVLSDENELAKGFYKLGFKYLNNLDTDRVYKDWGNSVTLLLQPYFPGMIRPIARNLFTLVLFIDPSHVASYHLLKTALTYRKHSIPIRFGIVFVVNDDESVSGFEDASVAMYNLYHFLKTDKGIVKAMDTLATIGSSVTDREYLTSNDALSFLKDYYSDVDANDVFGHDTDYASGRSAGKSFITSKGLETAPKVLLNGVVLEDSGIVAERFEETLTTEVMKATSRLRKAVAMKKLTDKENVMNWILNQPEIMPRLNKRILGTNSVKATYLDLFSRKICATKLTDFHNLPQSEYTQCIMQRMRYLSRTEDPVVRPITIWVVADLEDINGRALVYNAIKYLKQSHTMRVSIINNPKNIEESTKLDSISVLVNAAMRLLPHQQKKSFVTKLVKEEFVSKLQAKSITLEELAVNGMEVADFRKELKQMKFDEIVADAKFVRRVINFKAGECGVIANGHVIGPLDDNEILQAEDFQLIDKYLHFLGSATIAEHVESFSLGRDEVHSSDIIAGGLSLISMHSSKRKRLPFPTIIEEHSVINIPAEDQESEQLQVIAVVDPLSQPAQRITSFLGVLQKVSNLDVKLVMNPKGKLSELPLKRFYRMVLEPQIQFDSSGSISSSHYEARFTSLPNKQLLTLNVVPQDSWIVQAVYAVYDLDNIRMQDVVGNVIAKFELENILLEGQCFDEITSIPPRGLQFTLGTLKNPLQFDTIVMSNLGYFQLKANPGAWALRLRDGKSNDIYEISSYTNVESKEDSGSGLNVLIDSFTGRTIKVRVKKREGMEDENLLSEGKSSDEEAESSSIWNTISSSITGGETYDSINIFSVASGHLYERFLRIMMLSVLKNTAHPVKFWLLKNYLSPNFKETIPFMAKFYGFEYELVEYKWPRWLHRQTEKQRIMWGFKILFLDVLFPLNLRKIIFVDADQIVRTDLMELMKLDLGGAPYGFTPFCDSRKSMDGFRFWKKGYWATHLAGRKYHISALYVIDLVKFRQIAAGDRLRGQYHGLSADPNSLSNLDQDLPNNMIHQVKIKSLPQEWLWCETWCDDASKAKAKTIDLCNNPQTKEPKLNSAMRIIPEWKKYDLEIKEVLLSFTHPNVTFDQTKESIIDDKHGEL